MLLRIVEAQVLEDEVEGHVSFQYHGRCAMGPGVGKLWFRGETEQGAQMTSLPQKSGRQVYSQVLWS